MTKTPGNESAEISVLEIYQSVVEFCILGTSPMIMNRMSEKAKRELLLPKGRKSTAERAQNLKHSPLKEYRASAYKVSDDAAPARLCFHATGFKGAMASAALDLPGARKSEIGRLCWMEGFNIPIYGTPRLLMSVVKSADPNRTPDIRTRAILPEWACRLAVRFVRPRLTEQTVANLMAAAGVIVGVGDFRQEKGKGSFGQFALVGEDNADFQRIVKEQGRKAQDAALENPIPHDQDSEELLSWFSAEVVKLGRKEAA